VDVEFKFCVFHNHFTKLYNISRQLFGNYLRIILMVFMIFTKKIYNYFMDTT